MPLGLSTSLATLSSQCWIQLKLEPIFDEVGTSEDDEVRGFVRAEQNGQRGELCRVSACLTKKGRQEHGSSGPVPFHCFCDSEHHFFPPCPGPPGSPNQHCDGSGAMDGAAWKRHRHHEGRQETQLGLTFILSCTPHLPHSCLVLSFFFASPSS